LGVPAGEEVRVLALIPLGYPKDRPPGKKNRLPLEKLIHKERWDPLRT
jgi:nitroreductase